MRNYTSPKLTVLGAVAAETLASVELPLLKCSGPTDGLSAITKTVTGSVCPPKSTS